MSYIIGIDVGDLRVYDTIIPISEEDFMDIISSGVLPEKYCLSAVRDIRKNHKDIYLENAKVTIREDGNISIYLENTDLTRMSQNICEAMER